ncbi:hypothetical protein FISHEDRAFT_11960, partial [Fistulina hepatica ATCC 64428]
PPLTPETTVSGISIDPHTLERVIPESRRADGSVRKQLKIRPGYIPQEDVKRFRGGRQAQMDANQLPKGYIVGWVPPPGASAAKAGTNPMTKSQKKNAKRREKHKEKTEEVIKQNWEDDDDDEDQPSTAATATSPAP